MLISFKQPALYIFFCLKKKDREKKDESYDKKAQDTSSYSLPVRNK